MATLWVLALCSCRHDLTAVGRPCQDKDDCESGLVCRNNKCVQGADARVDGKVDTGRPDSTPKDAPRAEAGAPDLAQDTGKPDKGQPDTSKPDKGKPDKGQQDTSKPDAVQAFSIAKPLFTTTGSNKTHPAVATGPTNYLIVWADDTVKMTDNIYAVRINKASGKVVDSPPLYLNSYAKGDRKSGSPTVAFLPGQSEFIVGWEEDSGHSTNKINIVGVRLKESSGKFVPMTWSSSQKDQLEPAVACGTAECLMVWIDRQGGTTINPVYQIRGSRITTTTSKYFQFTSPSFNAPKRNAAVAASGSSYLVVWEDERSSKHEIYSSLVETTFTTAKEVAVSKVVTGSTICQTPAVVWGGGAYLVAWAKKGSKSVIEGRLVTTKGLPLGSNSIPMINTGHAHVQPVLARSLLHYVLVWSEMRASKAHFDLYTTRFTLAPTFGTVAPEVELSTAAGHQHHAAVAWGGQNYLVAWETQQSGSTTDVYAARVTK